MDKNIFVFFLWILTVYYTECTTTARVKPKRDGLIEAEPHPYTISFFTFPKGAANELLEPKRRESKRDSQDLSIHEKIKEAVPGKEIKSKDYQKPSVSVDSKETKSSLKVSTNKETKTSDDSKKHHQPFSQVSEKPSVLDKSGEVTEEQPEPGRQTVQPLEPWNLGPTHNKIQFHKHPAATHEELSESYQEGSINHPSHTMYPRCHHCPRNSSYEDCVSKTTLKKCDNGLNNICFTKSSRSSSRGILYEMGCSNHAKCTKAKAAPCKGSRRKCFVCCQFDGCNAQEHHYFQSTKNNDDGNLGYSAFNNKATTCWKSKWGWMLLLGLQLLIWILT